MELKPLSGCPILILEDEPLILLELSTMLRDHGAETSEVSTSIEARLALGKTSYSAALIDWQLEQGSAEDVVEMLSAGCIPTVIYSGYDIPKGLWRRFSEHQRHAVDWVAKPASPGVIVDALLKVLGWANTQPRPAALPAPF